MIAWAWPRPRDRRVSGTTGASAWLIVLALVLTACGRPAASGSDLRLDLQVQPSPAQVGPTTLLVTLRDADGGAVNDAVVEVEGNMTHPGMAPLTARVEGGENGLYRLPFTWSMGGDWVLTVVARLPDGRQIQADVPVAVEGR